jgi:hypothetical protein
MIHFREHRGGLAEAMEMLVTLDSRADLVAHIQQLMKPWGLDVMPEQVKLAFYGGPDKRIGWAATYVVTVKGYGVIGFADALE